VTGVITGNKNTLRKVGSVMWRGCRTRLGTRLGECSRGFSVRNETPNVA
jgi:hypothetical protein